MTTHELKTWPGPWRAVLDCKKTFEIRKADRDFKVDDILRLREWSPKTENYTGRQLDVKVIYTLSGEFGLPDDLVCMSIIHVARSVDVR